MKIASSTVQMTSARSYAAISKTTSKTSTQSILMSPSGGLPFSHTNLGVHPKKEGKGDSFHWENQAFSAPNIRSAADTQNSKTLAQIQEESLDYLMMLFFGKTPKSFAPSQIGRASCRERVF